MLTIESNDWDFIDITRQQECDNKGNLQVGVKLNAGPWKMTVESRLYILENNMTQEDQLRRDNPALQELWDHYKVMLALLKQ